MITVITLNIEDFKDKDHFLTYYVTMHSFYSIWYMPFPYKTTVLVGEERWIDLNNKKSITINF